MIVSKFFKHESKSIHMLGLCHLLWRFDYKLLLVLVIRAASGFTVIVWSGLSILLPFFFIISSSGSGSSIFCSISECSLMTVSRLIAKVKGVQCLLENTLPNNGLSLTSNTFERLGGLVLGLFFLLHC